MDSDLLALAERLEYATRDVVTGERLDAGVYGHAPIEDLEEAAAFIRSLLVQEPVANVMHCPFCLLRFPDKQPGSLCPKCHRELYAGDPERYTAPPAVQAEPVAWCHLEQWKSGQYWPDDCFGSQRIEGTVPLYAAPVPAVDLEAFKAEAMRLADAYANPENGEDYLSRAALVAHLDKLGGK